MSKDDPIALSICEQHVQDIVDKAQTAILDQVCDFEMVLHKRFDKIEETLRYMEGVIDGMREMVRALQTFHDPINHSWINSHGEYREIYLKGI